MRLSSPSGSLFSDVHLAWHSGGCALLTVGLIGLVQFRLASLASDHRHRASVTSAAVTTHTHTALALALWALLLLSFAGARGYAHTGVASGVPFTALSQRWASLTWASGFIFVGYVCAQPLSRARLGAGFETWAACLCLVWSYAGSVGSLLALLLSLELATTLFLVLLAASYWDSAAPHVEARASHTAAQRQQSFLWAALALMWSSALATLAFLWASAALLSSLPSLDVAAWALLGGVNQLSGLSYLAQLGLVAAVALKLMLPPAYLFLLGFYRGLPASALPLYLNLYYVYFLLTGACALLAVLRALLLTAGPAVGALMAGLVLAFSAGRAPMTDLRTTLALSTLFSLSLLTVAALALPTWSGAPALTYFLATYCGVLWALGLGLVGAATTAPGQAGGGERVTSAHRLWLVCALCALAGLPPSVLFFAKLSLLGALAQQAHWAALGVFGTLLFLVWGVYWRALQAARQPNVALPATPLHRAPATTLTVLVLTAALGWLAFGALAPDLAWAALNG